MFLINKGRYFAFWSTQLLKTKLYRRGYIVIMLGIFVAFFSATSLPVSVTIYFHGIFSHENQIQDPLNHRFIMSMFIFNPVVARDKQGRFFFFYMNISYHFYISTRAILLTLSPDPVNAFLHSSSKSTQKTQPLWPTNENRSLHWRMFQILACKGHFSLNQRKQQQ